MQRTQKTESKSPEVISWKGLRGNPFLQAFHPMMLESSGYLANRKVQVETKDKELSIEWKTVRYDREFVIRRLKIILDPLMVSKDTIKDIHSLIDEAFKPGYAEKYDDEQV